MFAAAYIRRQRVRVHHEATLRNPAFCSSIRMNTNQPDKIRTSLDRASLSKWKFSENNGFVVKDYTGLDPNSEEAQEPVILVLKSSDIFELLADAAAQGRKIAVYTIGPCILDQS
jgi:hypothetical protein